MMSAEIGVFGGSGFYSFLDDVERVDISTPYGPPSATFTIGTVADRRVAFLPRHGDRHELPPHRVNYRANVWAMNHLGVTRIFGPCAAGSLQQPIAPGHVVICDQLVDRTSGRDETFFDGPDVVHAAFADPYCSELRAAAFSGARAAGFSTHNGGTVVVIQGPRFSTRAESAWYGSAGWHIVNMTQHPEVVLARELGICYATLALVTDYDAGLDGVDAVSMDAVFRVFEANVERLKTAIALAISEIPDGRTCACDGRVVEAIA